MSPAISPYQTTTRRIGLALLAGALVAGALMSLLDLLLSTSHSLLAAIELFPYVFSAYAVGLVMASPIWRALHYRQHRSWQAAALLALGLMSLLWVFGFFVWPFILSGGTYLPGLPDLYPADIAKLAGFAAINVIVGLVVWRVAYRRINP
jgi:hypothetical protein